MKRNIPTAANQPVLADSISVQVLKRAVVIQQERAVLYDQANGERNMGKIVTAFNAITGHKLTESDGWQFMKTLKDVRLFSNRKNPSADSAVDGVSYGALLAECVQQRGL